MTPSLSSFTVLNAMQLGVIDCPPDADVVTLARTMADNKIHCVVVSGAPWGIVSDLDLMASLRPGVTATAGELAASDVVVVDPSDTLEHAAQLMSEHDTAHLVVASPDTGRPVGILSTLDIARWAAASPDAQATAD
jgi:CBS domain-containing protein